MVDDEMVEENGKVESSDQAPRAIQTSAPSSQEENQETATSSSTYRCSAPCNKKIKNTFNANLHPVLGVLLCRECYVSYGDGDFSKLNDGVDEQGDDNFCRWCCDGGDLIGCYSQDENGYTCHNVFCHECIAKNVPNDDVLTRIAKDPSYRWVCYACDPSKIDNQRRRAAQIMRELNEAEFAGDKQIEEIPNSQDDKEAEATKALPTPPREPSPDIPVAMIEDKHTEKPANGLSDQQAKTTTLPEPPREPSPDVAVEMVEMMEDEPTEKPTNGGGGGDQQATITPPEPLREPSPDIPVAMVEDTPSPPATTMAVALLNQSDLGQRLRYFSSVKEACMAEISTKFDLIVEAFQTGYSDKKLMSSTGEEIESMRRPISDLSEMLDNLQNLRKSYSSPAAE